jgi:hypothetical protein
VQRRRGWIIAAVTLLVLSVFDGAPAHGAPDPTYGTDGKVAVGGYVPIATDGTGRLLVLETATSPWTSARVTRYTADGLLDATYGTAGTATITWPAPVRQPRLLDVPAGAVTLWGVPEEGAPGALLGARFDDDGTPDAGFGTGGITAPVCCVTAATLPRTFLLDAVALDHGTTRLLVARVDRTTTVILDLQVTLDPVYAAAAFAGGVTVPDPVVGTHRLVAVSGARVLVASEEAAGLGLRATRVTRRTAGLAADPSFGTDGSRLLPGSLDQVAGTGQRSWIAVRSTRAGHVDIHALGADGQVEAGFGEGGMVTWGRSPWFPDFGMTGVPGLVPTPGGGVVVGGARLACVRVSLACDQYVSGAKVQQIAPDGSFGPVAAIDEADGELFGLAAGGDGASVLVARMEGGGAGAVRRIPVVDPRLANLAPFPTASALADQLAKDFLGRPATATEVAATAQQIDLGTPVSDLVRGTADRTEWTSRLDPVVRLYFAYFGRIPDHAGLRYWMGRRAGGVSVARISASFAGSSEFRRRYGSLSAQAFVALVYRNVLGREADPAGLAYWTRRVASGATSRGQLMASMSESSEHVRRRATTVRTIGYHEALLQRVPSATELEAWAGPTPVGDEDALVRQLLASPAFAARL